MPLLAAFALAMLATKTADAFDPGPSPLLMRHPTMNATTVVFQFAGDLWSVPREGGDAKRLTTAIGTESNPYFSPDGKWIAFSGQYDGNTDVFVIPAKGGVPRRLTAHPSPDVVLGWTPDGASVLFSSSMLSNTDYPRMFTVAATGGVAKPLPFPSGRMASFSPDGQKIAYVPTIKWQEAWKRYRGGQTAPIWIGNMSDSHVKPIPRENTNDEQPMWIGNSIYYLCDIRGPVGLFKYDTATGKETEEIKGEGFDIKSASSYGQEIVYEKLGSLHVFDTTTHKSRPIPVSIDADFLEVRPQFKSLKPNDFAISPTGQRLVVGARGMIFTVPASKGDIRQISGSDVAHRHDPAWSPNGASIAYFTDTEGDQMLAVCPSAGGAEKRFKLGEAPGVYTHPVWSPDSTKIAYSDTKLNLWSLDVATGVNTKIDTANYRQGSGYDPHWAPDSKWLTWNRELKNHFQAIFLYSFDTGKVTQITDGLADAQSPVFDRDGKHLYFLANTTLGQGSDFEDMSALNALNSVSGVYAIVLRRDGPNPLQAESDEEKAPTPPPAEKPKAEAVKVTIDLDNIQRRIISLPLPIQTYGNLEAGPAGSFFATTLTPKAVINDPSQGALLKFSFTDRKAVPFAAQTSSFLVSADGSKLLLVQAGRAAIVSAMKPPEKGEGAVDFTSMSAKIDPKAEWRHMYHEVWDGERLLLYDPHLHGIDANVMEKRYEPFLANICSRDDLNYLFTDMLGELSVGHMFIGGGDIPGTKGIPGGLLGADFAFEKGRYRLTRIYDGELWNPGLVGPLAQPGINAQVGEYVLAIDGKDLADSTDIYEALEGKAGRQVKVKLGPNSDGSGSREVIVVPVANEFQLRFRAWSEDNRRLVDKMTGGRAGYVHVPDTGGGGWTEFNRYFYAQAGKDGLIVDDRFNHGGSINDFMVREMKKTLDFGSVTRHGSDWQIPNAAIFGPKIMLINEGAGSGGDIFPYMFRMYKVGPLVGTRTWGAMISAYGFDLVDGGSIRAPDDAMYDPETGKWVIENEGVPPDVPTELDPYLWRQGRDAQLEKAIEVINAQLKNYHPNIKRPTYPDKSRVGQRG